MYEPAASANEQLAVPEARVRVQVCVPSVTETVPVAVAPRPVTPTSYATSPLGAGSLDGVTVTSGVA